MQRCVFFFVVLAICLPSQIMAAQGQKGGGTAQGGYESGMNGQERTEGKDRGSSPGIPPERQQVHREIWEDHAERMYRLNTRMHLDFAELEAEMDKDEPNEARIRQLKDEIGRLHSQMLQERFDLNNKLRKEGLPIHGRMQDYADVTDDLTSEQKEEFLNIWMAHDRDMAKVDKEMRSKFRELQGELAKDQPDRERIDSLRRDINRLHDDSLELQTEMHLQMRRAGIPLHPGMKIEPPYGRMPFLE
jgi:Spy/CpxP family protein refolding chaperone